MWWQWENLHPVTLEMMTEEKGGGGGGGPASCHLCTLASLQT